MKMTSLSEASVLRGKNRSPCDALSLCHFKRLFNIFLSCSVGLVTWAATDRSYAASGWHTVAMYAPLARYATYCPLGSTDFLTVPRELVRFTASGNTALRFSQCRSWVSSREFSFILSCPPLNLMGFSAVSSSLSLDRNRALRSSVSSAFAKTSSASSRVSSVYIPTIPKPVSFVSSGVKRRQGSYVDCAIPSFSR